MAYFLTLQQFYDLRTVLDLFGVKRGFHGAYATVWACQHGTPSPSRHLVPTSICSDCGDHFTELAVNFPIFHLICSSVLARCLLLTIQRYVRVLKYKKRHPHRCIHHFKSDLIYNMDHMRISGTEPLVGDPEPNKVFKKMKSYAPKSAETS